ncbi:hypothetical protein FH972_022640 [Carpinus fangiana]|uniref:RNA polymerase II-associated protein 1 N-terminal domain-containing protein n=1 Tax=Carpinus fangiana TaxID=176857 RepID=A0A5N6KTH6_9ROSI|nr:hypothetical protein FH972_022640 [Carpinus fangiana]
MAGFRGERFNIDVSDDEDERHLPTSSEGVSIASVFGSLVKDIQESSPVGKTIPVAPTFSNKLTAGGFPTHKKRTGVSRFKASRSATLDPSSPPASSTKETSKKGVATTSNSKDDPSQQRLQDERESIDQENRTRLDAMSPAEIEKERKELMSSLSPALLKKLLARATIDDNTGPDDFPVPESSIAPATNEQSGEEAESIMPHDPVKPKKTVVFAEDHAVDESKHKYPKTPITTSFPSNLHDHNNTDDQHDHDVPNDQIDPDLLPTPTLGSLSHGGATHFPRPPQPPPTLDPSSDTFLADLHAKYFPSLPTDPSKLSWMTKPDLAADPDTDTSYNPFTGPDAIPVTHIRFGFNGEVLPPSESIAIGTERGLHHHGDNPDAAGYTVPELAHLSRSSVAAQRCVAYQVLGRILYRLGIGEFGERGGKLEAISEEGQDMGGENWQEGAGRRGGGNTVLETGLWDCMERGRVVETLQEEVGRERGHVSAKAYATEALWLWQKGGGKKVMAT